MIKALNKAYKDYFTHVTNYGYLDINNVYALLVFDYIESLLNNDFRGMLTDQDLLDIKKAVEQLSRCSCLIPPNANSFHIGDLTELTTRTNRLELILNKLLKTVKNNEAKIDLMYPHEEKDLTNGPWCDNVEHFHHCHDTHHHHEPLPPYEYYPYPHHHHHHHCCPPPPPPGKTPVDWGPNIENNESE